MYMSYERTTVERTNDWRNSTLFVLHEETNFDKESLGHQNGKDYREKEGPVGGIKKIDNEMEINKQTRD